MHPLGQQAVGVQPGGGVIERHANVGQASLQAAVAIRGEQVGTPPDGLTADAIVPFTTSVELRDALTVAGKPFSFYTVVSGRDLSGAIVPGNHDIGPAFFEGGCVVLRLLAGTEPLAPAVGDYVVDVGAGVVTAPAPPVGAKCAA